MNGADVFAFAVIALLASLPAIARVALSWAMHWARGRR